MKVFGLTVLAKDVMELHYINHTVVAKSLAEADNIVLKYYQMIQDEFIEFDHCRARNELLKIQSTDFRNARKDLFSRKIIPYFSIIIETWNQQPYFLWL